MTSVRPDVRYVRRLGLDLTAGRGLVFGDFDGVPGRWRPFMASG